MELESGVWGWLAAAFGTVAVVPERAERAEKAENWEGSSGLSCVIITCKFKAIDLD